MLLKKKPSMFEIYNDIDGDVVNFFRVLREHPDDLIRAIQLTPFARAEQITSFDHTDGLSDLERARRLYVRAWQSYGGPRTQWHTGWRYQVSNTRHKTHMSDWNQVDHLWPIVARLKNVQIEQDDALRMIERFDRPETLFYCDPPYEAASRSIRWREKAYTFEIDVDYHRELARRLSEIEGMAVVSGKPSPLYEELYGGWKCLQRTVPTDFQSSTVECLWISPNAVDRQHQMSMDLDR